MEYLGQGLSAKMALWAVDIGRRSLSFWVTVFVTWLQITEILLTRLTQAIMQLHLKPLMHYCKLSYISIYMALFSTGSH